MITSKMIVDAAIEAGVATWGGEPMCVHGHVVTGINVALDNGRPRCRECKRKRQREWKRRKYGQGG